VGVQIAAGIGIREQASVQRAVSQALSRYSVGVKKFDHFGNFRVSMVSEKVCVRENKV